MKLIKEARRRIGNAWRAIRNSTNTSALEHLIDHGRRTDSGVVVNAQTLLEYAPIFYSVCKMGGHIGAMPKVVKRRDQLVTMIQSGLPDLLNLQPNNFMSAMDLFETTQKDAVISGNGRIAILRDETTGAPTSLIHIHPDSAWVFISYPDNGIQTVSERSRFGPVFSGVTKWHHITSANGETIILPDADVVHIKGLQNDGLAGIPLSHLARNSVGGGLGAEQHVNRTLRNNGVPGLILEAPEGVLTDKTKANEFLTHFRKMHEGSENASRTGLLRYGVTARQLSQSGKDSQLIENRKFTRDEAWMWTGDMLFFDGGSAYSNQQERDTAYKQHTLGRWVAKWEAELNIKMLSPAQRRRGWHIDLDQSAILRGSLKQRLEAYEIARRIGYLSQEEIRELDGLPAPDPDENFDNPNTTSGNGDEPAPASASVPALPAPAEPPSPVDDYNRRRLSGFLKKETRAMNRYAKQPRSFAGFVDEFYRLHATKIEAMADELGIDNWAEDSKFALLTAAECQPDELITRVFDLTHNWPAKRANQLLEV